MAVDLIPAPTVDLGAIAPIYEPVIGDLRPIGLGITPLKMAYYNLISKMLQLALLWPLNCGIQRPCLEIRVFLSMDL